MSNDSAPVSRSRTPRALAAAAAALALAVMAVPSQRPATERAVGATDARAMAASVAPRRFACGARPAPADVAPPIAPLAPALERLRAALYAPDRSGRLERWSGEGERTECRDADSPYAVTWRFELEQLERVRTLDGTLILSAFESRHSVAAPRRARLVADTLVAEAVSLPDIDAWAPDPAGGGLVAALSARRTGAATGGCRGIAVSRCTAELDIGWRLRAAGSALSLEQTFWVAGRASERVVWRLDV